MADTLKALLCVTISATYNLIPRRAEDRYFIGVPINHPHNNDQLYGVFTLNGKKTKTFDSDFYEKVTLEVVKAISAQITYALSKIGN